MDHTKRNQRKKKLLQSDLQKVFEYAKEYDEKLKHNEILLISKNRKTKKYSYVSFKCKPENFMNLTGVVCDKKQSGCGGATHFLDMAVQKRLSTEYCYYKADGSTKLKLQGFPQLINYSRITKMVGDYNHSRINVIADKMLGNVSLTIGLVKDNANDFVPCTLLIDDIRNSVADYEIVKGIFVRRYKDDMGNNVTNQYSKCYIARDFDYTKLPLAILTTIEK